MASQLISYKVISSHRPSYVWFVQLTIPHLALRTKINTNPSNCNLFSFEIPSRDYEIK